MVRSIATSSFFGLPPFNNPFAVVRSRRDSQRRVRQLLDRLSPDQQLELLGLSPIGNADGGSNDEGRVRGDLPTSDRKSVLKPTRKGGKSGIAGNGEVEEEEEEEDNGEGDDMDDNEEDEDEDEEEEEEEEDEDDEGSDGDDAEKGDEEILMVDFDFFDSQPSDYHGVKALLRTFLDGKRWDLPAFVDAITAGPPGGGAAAGEGDAGGATAGGGSVATVVKAGDEGSVLGLTACLPLICKSKGWTADFVRFLHEGCDNKAQWDELWGVLQRGRVGVVLCERVANLPFQLVPHLFRSTLQPMLEKGAPVEKFLILTRMYRQTGGKASRKQHKGAAQGSEGGPSELFFPKPEDELLKKLATSSYSFPVHADIMASRQLKGFQHLRLVMLLSAAQIRTFLEKVNDMVDDD
ncbi:hypothetical protein CLOM_g2502 [Closterium sp. NIES-68]|nr:hypothetical protein CLOM_g2502 [Closterium sp. NIES-68]GJP74302.1 hypothetical protein CLOP_g4908 [Closterium sp. NIES-67]